MTTIAPARPDLDHQLLDEPEVATAPPERERHYVNLDDLAAAMASKSPVTALCGHVYVPTTTDKTLPVCQPCKAIYDDTFAMALYTRD